MPGTYRLIFVVWNALFNLLTQEGQVRCFGNVADHLIDDGFFVVEAFMPAFLYRLCTDQCVDAEAIRVDEVRLDALRHDMATQMIEESHVSLSSAGVRLNPVIQQYAWPSKLDLMARIAGLRLKYRWGGWHRERWRRPQRSKRNCGQKSKAQGRAESAVRPSLQHFY